MMIFFLTETLLELVVCVRSVDISMCVCVYILQKKVPSWSFLFCIFSLEALSPSQSSFLFWCQCLLLLLLLLLQSSLASYSSSTHTHKNYYAYNQNSSYQDIVLKEHQKVVPFNVVFIRRDILRSLYTRLPLLTEFLIFYRETQAHLKSNVNF